MSTGCLSANVTLASYSPNVNIDNIASLDANINLISERLDLSIRDISQRLKVRCGIVCSLVDLKPSLEVDKQILWFTDPTILSQEVIIYSNTDWSIEHTMIK